jgi:DUF4097 and DUF4098 domain-containing protein YvlB
MASTPPMPPGGNPPGRPPGPPSGPPSGTPPGIPPGNWGVPYGANPRDYWRYQKDQNRAAWRAQRDAWRAQRDLLRSQNRANRTPSIAGPIVLISVGIIALLLITGRLNADAFWDTVGHWWPLMLIGLGVIALAEWAIDLRRENPPSRRYGGFIWLVIIVLFVGAGGAGWHRFWGPFRAQFGDDNGDFFNGFGLPQHSLDQAVLTTKIPANAKVQIQSPRGDVSIAAGDGEELAVTAHQIAYANSDADAKKIFDSQQAHVTVTGNTVLVRVDGNNSGRTNLTITLPKSASVNVNSEHGGVTVAGLSGSVDADVQHGDVETTAIQGNIHVRISSHGDFSAHDVNGDVSIEGNGGDLTLTDIHGKVTIQGDYTGDTHLERVDQTVHFHSSRTDLEFARLPGDMSLDGDSLHATQVVGPARVICSRSKDIEMTQIYGDTRIEDKNARVELGMAGSYNVDVKNVKGDVELALPPGVGASVDAHTRNGDIVSDFPLEISGDENKTMTGTIGKGGPKITLSTEHADLRLRKGDEAEALPPLKPVPPVPNTTKQGAAPKAPVAPNAPKVPHLKPQSGDAPATVSQ